MNINKYTEKAQEAVLGAQQLAEQASHPQIEPEHLLVALVEQRDGIVPEVLRKMDVGPGRDGAGRARAAGEDAAGVRRVAAGPVAAAQAGRPTWRRPRPTGSRTSTSAPSTCSSAIADETGRSPAAQLLKPNAA